MSGTDRLAIQRSRPAPSPCARRPARLVALNAQPSARHSALLEHSRLVCEQPFRPTHDALLETAAFATTVASRPVPAAMVLVTLTRARAAEFRRSSPARLDLLPPGGLLAVIDGTKTDGIDSLAKHMSSGPSCPSTGQITKAHGRVFWLRRPRGSARSHR